MKYCSVLLFWCLLLSAAVSAQPEDIGPVISLNKTTFGVEGRTSAAYFRITVYNEHVIRVRVSRKKEFDDFSYILTDTLTPGHASIQSHESGNSYFIHTSAISMELHKEPGFRIIFRNHQGKVINEDFPGTGFGTSYSGDRATLYKKLQKEERFVGLGEVLGNLDKRGNIYTLNNTDTYKYGDPRLPMYLSVPFYIGILNDEVYGLFLHNSCKSTFNFGVSTPDFMSVTVEGGDIDYFFIYDNSVAGILYHYTGLTGRMPLPPIWSLGYHQSRCSYYPQQNVELLAKNFRSRKIPLDCIVLDADYLKDYEPFRINTSRFPDMKALSGKLKYLGIELTASVNPGIKIDTSYFAYHEGLALDLFVKYMDGSPYRAEIAPSMNHFVDFTNPSARSWWAKNMKFLADNDIHGYWNDMNEPAVGASYLPDNLDFDFDGRKAGTMQAKNLYGMLMARSSFESAEKYGNGKRPFVLSRSGFAGIQRYAAVWTGDNTAKDEYLLSGALLNAQMGLSGIPFVGDDIGGYIGNTSKELFIRWIQSGIFAPFARNHKEAYAPDNEPWSYGTEAEAISREFIGFRYRLLPYLYSKFFEASAIGMPVVRSLCINDPFDPKVYIPEFQSQFMCGDALLVIPTTSAEKMKKLYLPGGRWFDINTDMLFEGNQEIYVSCPIFSLPVFVRESSIVPMQNLVQSTKEAHNDTLFLHVYNGTVPSEFIYYEDDGSTRDYLYGVFYKRAIRFDPENRLLIIEAPTGKFNSSFKVVKCIFHGFNISDSTFVLNGTPLASKPSGFKVLDGLRYLSDTYLPEYYQELRASEKTPEQKSVLFKFDTNRIEVGW